MSEINEPDPRNLCGRLEPHGPHIWIGSSPSRPDYHGKTFECPGKWPPCQDVSMAGTRSRG